MHEYGRDLYGCTLKVIILGYIRPEKNFDSLKGLIDAINNDITEAKELLNSPENIRFKTDNFFKENNES